jgi:DNA-binding XRE family transcriptional regulator
MKTNIREFREKLGLSQDEFAEKAGVARTVISQLENGNRAVIRSDTMAKIAKALNKPIEDIFML